MLQRDYLMKMVEMMAVVMAKVLLNKENKNYDEALEELETAGKTIIGLDIDMVKILNIDDIVGLMKTSDIYAGRCLICAELLFEYAAILEKKGNPDSNEFYNKSFRLYSEALLTKEIPEPEIYFEKNDALISKLSDAGYFDMESSDNNLALFEYFELRGKFSKAEDVLFKILESDCDDEYKSKIRRRAVSFYKDLLNLEESELILGNFSSEEAEDSLQEILEMIKLNKN